MRKAAFHNLGCKVNAYETEAMEQALERAGWQIVPFNEKADVYVINTCSVTNIADRKSRQMLHRAKSKNPEAVVVAAGCYVETAMEKTGLSVDADIILGNNKKQDLPLVLEEYFSGQSRTGKLTDMIDINHTREYEKLSISRTMEHTRAYLKVQDGCNQFCTYCIIPYARGRVRCRDIQDVTQEVKRLAESGVREIVLTGIHLTSYQTENGAGLSDLIEACADQKGIDRIRLGSLEPRIITEDFVRRTSALPSMCPHFHLALQSGCDTVLGRMNRKYTAEEFAAGCQLLRDYFDDPAITTDIIVGFPQETEAEFQMTVDFVKQIHFYETHIFKYSMRKGTRAAAMSGQLPENIKTQRSEELIRIGRENKAAFEKRREGKRREVILEEPESFNGRMFYTGHTREYIRAAVSAAEGEDFSGRTVTGILHADLSLPDCMRLDV